MGDSSPMLQKVWEQTQLRLLLNNKYLLHYERFKLVDTKITHESITFVKIT